MGRRRAALASGDGRGIGREIARQLADEHELDTPRMLPA